MVSGVMTTTAIRVAIIGGGLGGSVLMNALMKHSHLDVHLYEARSEFQERGASVGIGKAAGKALQVLGLEDVVKRASPVQAASSRWLLGEGPDAGKYLFDLVSGLQMVHRAALLRELLAPIPKNKLHLGKKLSSISASGKKIHFEDGDTVTADLVIGADGIHSSVRKYILGEGHPAIEPVFAGFWDCRGLIPASVARQKLGSHRIREDKPRQHMYLGNGAMALHDTIDDGQTICVVVGGSTPAAWDKTQWKQSVSRKRLDEIFENWGELGSNLLDLLCGDKDEMSTFVQWASAEAPTLYDGTTCMMGDAAHATTPWQGSGFALSVEDSMILSTVLGKCNDTRDIPTAFQVYDQIMRPRGQQIVESSHETGMMCVGGSGLDPKQLSEELPPRWNFITEWDTEGTAKNAAQMFNELKWSSMHPK